MAAGSPASRAVERRPAATGAVPLVAGGRLPLSFIGFGLIALVGAAACLAASPEILRLPHVHPHVAALAHAWLPGFLLSVCVGAVYQLCPVVLGTPLRLPLPLAWIHLGLHAAGVALLVAGFTRGDFPLVAIGGTLVAMGVTIFSTAVWRTFAASARRDAVAWSFPLAATWLAATVLAGVVLGLNRRFGFLPLSVVDLLHAHAHLGLAGFFVTLLQGATFQLVPMFTMAELKRPRFVTAGLLGGQGGLLGLIPALAVAHRGATIMGAAVLAGGIFCSGAALVATLRSRRRKVLEPGLKAFVTGAVVLGVAAFGGLGLALRTGPVGDHVSIGYGVAIVGGALSFMVLGMLCKIVPFLVWMQVYGPRAGRQPVPLANALGAKFFEQAWLGLHVAALGALLAGVALASAGATALGAALLLTAVLAFVANISRVLAHCIRPQLAAAVVAPRVPASP